jgi:hypothetical protein
MMVGSWPLKVTVFAIIPPNSSVLNADALLTVMSAVGV